MKNISNKIYEDNREWFSVTAQILKKRAVDNGGIDHYYPDYYNYTKEFLEDLLGENDCRIASFAKELSLMLKNDVLHKLHAG